jgi:hypothetical protein
MMKRVNDQEFAHISALAAPHRYRYFVSQVADWEEVWSLRSPDGWVISGGDDGREYVPVWPHRRYAEACATGRWAGSEPTPIPLARWIEAWLPGIARDGRLVAVFPLPDGQSPCVTAERLRDDLLEEAGKYAHEDETDEPRE